MNNKLNHILATLNSKEKTEFSNLIETSLIGGNKNHRDFLNKFINSKESKSYGMKERLLMSDLCKMLEKYLVIKTNLAHPIKFYTTLTQHYAQHEDQKLFLDSTKHWEKHIEYQYKNAFYYESLSELEYEKWKFEQLKSRFSNIEADNIIGHSEISLISKKLAEAVSLAPQSVLISKKINTAFLDFIESYIIEKGYLSTPCISLYYYALKMIFEPQVTNHFDNFKKELEKSESLFTNDELRTLYFQAINYCIRKHNSGDKTYSQLLLNYYKMALQKGFLLTHGYLSKNSYRNINTIAIRLGQFDDAKLISETYNSLLRNEEQHSAYQYNMANIYYSMEKYDDALMALREINFDDHLSNLTSKLLILKIYYETGEMRLLDSHLDAMQVYLTRKKVIGYHKTVFSNIVKFTRKLINLNPYDSSEKSKLKESILAEKSVADKDWILAQLDKT